MKEPVKPLSGIRVIDFTWAALGPYAGYLLASLGAQVIHVGRPQSKMAGSTTASIYHELNVGKINVGIDVKHPEGRDLLVKLIEHADVFFENFRPGVVEKLQLGFDDVNKINPRLVMVSGSAIGRAGADGNFVGYAPIFTALSGLAHLTGYADGPPVEIRHPADLTAGAVAAFAALAGLASRKQTGKGLYIDLSARDAILWTLSAEVAATQNNKDIDSRIGNESRDHAPHDVYQCAGNNAWISIVAASDDDWKKLCEAIGSPSLATRAQFRTTASRLENKKEISGIIEEWTRARPLEQCLSILQGAGIAAFPSLTNKGIFEDPHVQARKTLQLDQVAESKVWSAGPPWIFHPGQRDALKTVNGDDALDYVFSQILQIPKPKLNDLQKSGIVG